MRLMAKIAANDASFSRLAFRRVRSGALSAYHVLQRKHLWFHLTHLCSLGVFPGKEPSRIFFCVIVDREPSQTNPHQSSNLRDYGCIKIVHYRLQESSISTGCTYYWLLLLVAEIRRSPVEVGSWYHYLRSVFHIPGGFWKDFWTINSTSYIFWMFHGSFHHFMEALLLGPNVDNGTVPGRLGRLGWYQKKCSASRGLLQLLGTRGSPGAMMPTPRINPWFLHF